MRKSKQAKSIFLAITMAMVCIFSVSVANATQITEKNVFYEKGDIKKYWGKEETPVKEGYVFGGWFSTDDEKRYEPLTAVDIDSNGDGNVDFEGRTYAKWVPSYVLSVKGQIDLASQKAKKAAGEGGNAFLRVISTVDSTDYLEVGFDLYYDKYYKETENTVITKVYESIKNDETGTNAWKPQEQFGPSSKYFSILKVNYISNDNCDNILYVRPYWKTMDGTRVEGISKYIRVMDGYDGNEYISVPVNLMTGSKVAAGRMQMSYDTNLTYIGYEPGVLFPNMKVNTDTAGTIKFVGNANTVNTDVKPESDIYANVWFQAKDNASTSEQLIFTMLEGDFCDWAEELVTDIIAWDVWY